MKLLYKRKSPSALKKINAGLASIAMLSGVAAGTVFATNPAQQWMDNTGGFDNYNFFECVLQAYKTANSIEDLTEVLGPDDALSEEGLAAITSLSCNSQSITSATGVNKLPNLQTLNLADNSLTSIDLSQNKKLINLRLDNNSLTLLDVSSNANLEELFVANNPIQNIDISSNVALNRFYISDAHVTTSARAKKTSTGYAFNMSSLAWFSDDASNWNVVPNEEYSYNSATKTILISERKSLADGFQATYREAGGYPNSTITISANPAKLNVHAYLNINANTDSEGVLAIDEYVDKYIGERWDSDEYLDALVKEWKERGAVDPKLVKVEAFNFGPSYYNENPNVDVGILDGSVDTHIFGIMPDNGLHPNVAMVYYFEDTFEESSEEPIAVPDTAKTPDTGSFTADGKGLAIGISVAAITAIASVVYLLRYAINRQKTKVRFSKK